MRFALWALCLALALMAVLSARPLAATSSPGAPALASTYYSFVETEPEDPLDDQGNEASDNGSDTPGPDDDGEETDPLVTLPCTPSVEPGVTLARYHRRVDRGVSRATHPLLKPPRA